MRAIKYVITLFLLLIAFLATGERFIYHLVHFENTFSGMTFEYELYGQKGSTALTKDKIASALEENTFDVFRIDTRYLSDFKEEKIIYGTRGALEELRRRGIVPQVYKSMFIGEVEIIFKDFSEIENIYESDVFYYIGTLEQAASFKNITASELAEYYQVKELKVVNGSESGVYATLILVWGTAFLLVLFLTLYQTIISRKEMMIRMTLGDNPLREFSFNVILDTTIYSVCFFVLAFILEQFAHVHYKFGYILVMFFSMLALNALINLLTTRISLKKDLSNSLNHKGILTATYIVKSISTLMAFVVLSANCIIIVEAFDCFKQEKFFETQKDYGYYKLNYSTTIKNSDDLKKVTEDEKGLWYKFDSRFGNNSLHLFDLSDSYGRNVVLLNSNAMDLMLPYIGADLEQKVELAKASGEEKIFVFFPKDYDLKTFSETIEMTAGIFLHNIQGDINEHLTTDVYEKNSYLLGVNSGRNMYRSVFLKNPIVIFDVMEESYIKRCLNPLYLANDFLYSVPDLDFEQFINTSSNSENMIVRATNAWELYLYNRAGIERTLKLMSAVSALIMLLEILMIAFIVRLEYTINGIEMSVKKTLGYSLIEQNKRLFALPCVLLPFYTVCAIVVVKLIGYGDAFYVLLCGMAIFAIEVLFVTLQCIRTNKIKTTSILKGKKV
ncbi:MAG: hypothetical protein LBK75_07680 [Oscillospiraceae bacterium]|jgi:hypothetical protein|nr:hypothetical protein [Oscillospiraceae bacterium]